MTSFGYDPERFVGLNHEEFECIICSQIVCDPQECHGCGKLFCQVCINDWGRKNIEVKCPNRCTANNITPIRSKALLKMYNGLDIKCSNDKCQKVVKLIDLAKHEISCKLPKCWNYDICEQPLNSAIKGAKPCCSEVCNLLLGLVSKYGDRKAMFELLNNYIVSLQPAFTNSFSVGSSSQIPLPPSPQIKSNAIVWDIAKCGKGIDITADGTGCFLKEQAYLFKSVLANHGFNGGVHYWEIIGDPRTDNELKIGVSLNGQFDYSSAFCDHPFGFAYYGIFFSTQVWASCVTTPTRRVPPMGSALRTRGRWECVST